MTRLEDVLDTAALAKHITEGHIRTQVHPADPWLTIYNYTEKAAYDGVWTPETLACRGLIADAGGKVLARPLRKFFNYGQTGAPELALDAAAVVTDKADGSLGITYRAFDGLAIATRGSFSSEQAIHATHVLRTRYPRFAPPEGTTVLFEIIYPQNRIVVDYAGLDDLVLLGTVDIGTGRTSPPDGRAIGWTGPVTETFAYATLGEALAADPRPNSEGLVVHLVDSDERVKLKQADYVALHRIVTGLNARTVWQHLIDFRPIAELIDPIPDEFHPWVREVAAHLDTVVAHGHADAVKAFNDTVSSLPEGWGRKEFAAVAVPHPLKWALFLMLDGRDIRPTLWRNARPDARWNPSGRDFTEDAA